MNASDLGGKDALRAAQDILAKELPGFAQMLNSVGEAINNSALREVLQQAGTRKNSQGLCMPINAGTEEAAL